MPAITSKYTIVDEKIIRNQNYNIAVVNHSCSKSYILMSCCKYWLTFNVGCYFYDNLDNSAEVWKQNSNIVDGNLSLSKI